MAIRQKMKQPKQAEILSQWHLVDASGKTLGRLCSEIAQLLQGKHKTEYVPYMNTGDHVIVVNAEQIRVTGKKLEQKKYYRHSGYHGGLTERTLQQVLDTHPERVVKQCVKGMLPKNIPGRRMLGNLRVYSGPEHPHQSQIGSTVS